MPEAPGPVLEATEPPVADLRLLVEPEPWPRVFVQNLRAFFQRPEALRRRNHQSASAVFWPDVFVDRGLPWRRFLESGACHVVVLAVIWAGSRFLALQPHHGLGSLSHTPTSFTTRPRNTCRRSTPGVRIPFAPARPIPNTLPSPSFPCLRRPTTARKPSSLRPISSYNMTFLCPTWSHGRERRRFRSDQPPTFRRRISRARCRGWNAPSSRRRPTCSPHRRKPCRLRSRLSLLRPLLWKRAQRAVLATSTSRHSFSDCARAAAFAGRTARGPGQKFHRFEQTFARGDRTAALAGTLRTLPLRRRHDCAQPSSRSRRTARSACGQSPRQLRRHPGRPSGSLRSARRNRWKRERERKWIRQRKESHWRSAFGTVRRQELERHVSSCRRPRPETRAPTPSIRTSLPTCVHRACRRACNRRATANFPTKSAPFSVPASSTRSASTCPT